MEVVHPRCCGLDIHKKLIVACVIVPDSSGRPYKQVHSFGTMSDDLQHLSEWLAERGVTPVAMESTGSYWKPVFNVLEERFELLPVNAQHLKAVPGRKTDVNDAEWIAGPPATTAAANTPSSAPPPCCTCRTLDDLAAERHSDLGQVLGQVRGRIVRYRELAIGEQDTKAALIDPVLRALGRDVEDLEEVQREYRLKSATIRSITCCRSCARHGCLWRPRRSAAT